MHQIDNHPVHQPSHRRLRLCFATYLYELLAEWFLRVMVLYTLASKKRY